MMNNHRKCISLRNALLFLSLNLGVSLLGQTLDPLEIAKNYPSESFVLLNYDVEMELTFDDSGEPFVKTKHKKEYLTLESGVSVLNRFLLTFSETQEIKVKSARVYQYIDNKKKLVNNVKTKWLKPRDHFIKGVFFNDIQDLEIVTNRRLGKFSHITIEYEVIDHDLKFINPIYVSSYGEHVVNFNMTLIEPYDAVIDIVPFNVDGVDFSVSTVKGNSIYSISESPRIKSYPNDPPYNYVAPHFVPVVREVAEVSVLKTKEDLYEWYNGLISTLKKGSEKTDVLSARLTADSQTEEEKIESIFSFVQKHIDYLAFEDGIAGFKPENSENLLLFGYGDCKGMSNLLVDLLKSANIDCGHAWVGTRRLNYKYDLAALCVDNHMVCWVKVNEEIFILDATGKNHKWNLIPSHLQGKEVMLGKEEGFEIINVPISNAENNEVLIDLEIFVDKDSSQDKVQGEIKLTGNEALDFYSAIESESLQSEFVSGEWIVYHFLGNYLEGVSIKQLNYDSKEVTLNIEFEGVLDGAKLKNDNEVNFYTNLSESFIQVLNPELPVFFQNKIRFVSNITLSLAPGLTVSSLPENHEFNSDEFSLSYQVQNLNGKINETREMVINSIYSDDSELTSREGFSKALKKVNENPIKLTVK